MREGGYRYAAGKAASLEPESRPKFSRLRILQVMASSWFVRRRPAQGTGFPPSPGKHQLAVTYIGHATVLLQFGPVNVLTDPVYAPRLILPKRLVEPGIPMDRLPPLDLILISHGHLDHLDVPSLRRLPKSCKVVVAENLGDLAAACGFADVVELRWGESVTVKGVEITALPVRHWGTRGFLPDRRSFAGFVLRAAAGTVFFPGDTAYFSRLKDYGRQFPIDVALLPIGAYRPDSFRRVHMNPQDALKAFQDLGARYMIPIHWGTFIVSYEPPDEPVAWLEQLTSADSLGQRVIILQHGQSRVFDLRESGDLGAS